MSDKGVEILCTFTAVYSKSKLELKSKTFELEWFNFFHRSLYFLFCT